MADVNTGTINGNVLRGLNAIVVQTLNHIATECRSRRFPGTMSELNEADEAAVLWQNDLDI